MRFVTIVARAGAQIEKLSTYLASEIHGSYDTGVRTRVSRASSRLVRALETLARRFGDAARGG